MSLKINGKDYKLFRLGDIFDIKKGKRLTSADQTEGDTIYIGAIDTNNGVSNHIGQSPIHEGNTISLSYNGSVGEAFYQSKPYRATDDVNALYFKKSNNYYFNKYIALFICTILRKEKYRYNYGRKRTLEKMKISEIALPIDDSGNPDWKFMENYIKSLHYKPITTKNKPGKFGLNISLWKEFKVGNLFPKIKVEKFSAIPESDGDKEFVSSTSTNNGVSKYVDENTINGNCITVSTNGDCFDCFYHKNGIVVSNDVEVLYSEKLNKYTGMFICSILQSEKYRWCYGRKPKNGKVYDTIIKLPVDDFGNPDREFMEDYIKNLPYGDRI